MILFQKLKKYRWTSAVFLASYILVILVVVWGYIVLYSSSQPLILHYSEYTGITKIGNITDLLFFGILGLILISVNFVLAITLQAREQFLGKLLTGATLFLAILIFIAFSAIISVN